jgi:hypothetical protein
MIRAMVVTKDAASLKEAYNVFQKMERITIVRVKNKLNSNLQQVSVNFIISQ